MGLNINFVHVIPIVSTYGDLINLKISYIAH